MIHFAWIEVFLGRFRGCHVRRKVNKVLVFADEAAIEAEEDVEVVVLKV